MTSPLPTRLCLIVGGICGIFCGGQGSPLHSQSSSLGGDCLPLRGALRFDSVRDYSILFFSSLLTTAVTFLLTGSLRCATHFRQAGPLRSAVLVPFFTATDKLNSFDAQAPHSAKPHRFRTTATHNGQALRTKTGSFDTQLERCNRRFFPTFLAPFPIISHCAWHHFGTSVRGSHLAHFFPVETCYIHFEGMFTCPMLTSWKW